MTPTPSRDILVPPALSVRRNSSTAACRVPDEDMGWLFRPDDVSDRMGSALGGQHVWGGCSGGETERARLASCARSPDRSRRLRLAAARRTAALHELFDRRGSAE